jgi:hypothetical protein
VGDNLSKQPSTLPDPNFCLLPDVIMCQSIARRNSESRKVEKLWNDHRSECAAILIQANWRAFSVAKEYKCIISKVVTIQSTVRMWLAAKRWKVLRQEILSAFARFQSQGRYTLTAKGKCLLNDYVIAFNCTISFLNLSL